MEQFNAVMDSFESVAAPLIKHDVVVNLANSTKAPAKYLVLGAVTLLTVISSYILGVPGLVNTLGFLVPFWCVLSGWPFASGFHNVVKAYLAYFVLYGALSLLERVGLKFLPYYWWLKAALLGFAAFNQAAGAELIIDTLCSKMKPFLGKTVPPTPTSAASSSATATATVTSKPAVVAPAPVPATIAPKAKENTEVKAATEPAPAFFAPQPAAVAPSAESGDGEFVSVDDVDAGMAPKSPPSAVRKRSSRAD